ncbi:MAG: hypothetical protein HOI53_02235 [Francisellaceae bacterium]|jgi:hypothetical protein|nr:hypothetical protein [Francisellaceae bacterium]MBT6206821.1 hypothetical protein [Francisellaceae bacterium]MBT6538812.1 hypothetical protein [Francisellaceae bacterium]
MGIRFAVTKIISSLAAVFTSGIIALNYADNEIVVVACIVSIAGILAFCCNHFVKHNLNETPTKIITS